MLDSVVGNRPQPLGGHVDHPIRVTLVGSGLAVVSLAAMPTWPREWLAQLPDSPYHFSPLRTPLGFILLLALARWRRPEARLLVVLGIVPQSPFVYEVLPLFLIPKSRFQTYALVIGSDLALGVYAWTRGMDTERLFFVNGTLPSIY